MKIAVGKQEYSYLHSMKPFLLPCIIIVSLSACNRKTVWPDEDQQAFNDICSQAVYGLYSKEDGQAYCSCVLEQIMEAYPDPETSKDIPFEVINGYADDCISDLELITIDKN
jgi:hypothetical protein